MARPTEWRRGFDRDPGFGSVGFRDLVALQPGETLGGAWWSYSLKSVANVPANTLSPLGDAIVCAGLALHPVGVAPPVPLQDANDDWLWWEQVGFDSTLVNNIDFAYSNVSTSGRDQRKAKGMRKNDTEGLLVLGIGWEASQGSAGAAELDFQMTCAVSALIILP